MLKHRCAITGFVCSFVFLASALFASDGGSLSGTVSDPSGKAIPGAKATATEPATAVKQTVATDGRDVGQHAFETGKPG